LGRNEPWMMFPTSSGSFQRQQKLRRLRKVLKTALTTGTDGANRNNMRSGNEIIRLRK
jgi:hypothetical protein